MRDMVEWPAEVDRLLSDRIGATETVRPLGGMSGARVWAVAGPAGRVVVKRTASRREAAVYGALAPTLIAAGVSIPASLGQVDTGAGSIWLILEYIAEPLPRHRWLGDPDVMATLAQLQVLELTTLRSIPDPYRPSWSLEMAAATAARFADPSVGWRLDRLRAESQPLFAPNHVISGDANPANWGVRDGRAVLMDWERIGFGHPALDVGITVPGLGTPDDFARVAEVYNEESANREAARVRVTPRQLALAKAWSIAEFLVTLRPASPNDGPARRRAETVKWLTGALPGWLKAIG